MSIASHVTKLIDTKEARFILWQQWNDEAAMKARIAAHEEREKLRDMVRETNRRLFGWDR